MPETTRVSLLERVRDPADHVAWQEFDTIYRRIITRYAMFHHLDADLAEEAASQVMIRLARRMPSFEYEQRRPGRFRAFIKKILKRVIIDLDRPEAQQSGILEVLGANEDEFSVFELDEQIRHCMAKVEERARNPKRIAAYKMRVIEQRPTAEVCQALDMSAQEVYVAKHEVTEAMRKCLEEFGFVVP